MNNWPPRQHSQALRFLHYSPHYKRLRKQPPFHRVTTCLRRWAQRATPPLLYHRESQLTYTAEILFVSLPQSFHKRVITSLTASELQINLLAADATCF
ncbi:hypothetical protein AVEN_104689-1 [Araneus ventricosus]|uniref:Uncharacterized protein n=1 Tax=Araneus ventricosus TaxID=182803 RepID=A0A4Y2L5Y0_ARAVE|nr:hypothetical protein AVEN_104689-1 [Araneus ventricosus]